MPSNKVRTRFAPSPTGYMHVGNLRTALYTYLMAKHEDGTFILRIEDTDQGRYVEGAVDVIYNTLREAGLNWDEGPDIGGPVGPYVQSERMGMFKQYAEQLVAEGKAYYCFCTEERLEALHAEQRARGEMTHYDGCCRDLPEEEVKKRLAAGEPYVIRQKIPRTGITGFDDVVYGHIEVNNSEMDDQILIKTDGMPTYNFANVVDDHLMGITHVIRGSEYLSSTPKYNLLYEAFGWDIPTYVHCSPVMRDQHNKMSKRHGDPSYEDLKAQGYLTEAILNYVALLGWAPKGERSEQEIFSLDELVDAFLDMMEKHKMIVENAGLLPIAALSHLKCRGKNVVPVLSGGNMDVITMASLVQHGLIMRGRIFTFSVLLPDRPGALLSIADILARENGNVIKLEHNQFVNINRQNGVELKVTLEAFGQDHKRQILDELRQNGYSVQEVMTADFYH